MTQASIAGTTQATALGKGRRQSRSSGLMAGQQRIRLSVHAWVALVILCGAGLPALALTRTVNNLNDSGTFSLRYWLANAFPGDTILFSNGLTGTIVLTNAELTLVQNLTISGPGPAILAISGRTNSRIFNIQSGVAAMISGLAIINGLNAGMNGADARDNPCHGSGPGDSGNGGGILNHGSLVISNCVFSNNIALGGNGGGGINCAGSAIPPSSGGGAAGGAIYSSGTLTLLQSGFFLNAAVGGNAGNGPGDEPNVRDGGSASGAAVYCDGVLNVTNCTFSSNAANGGLAGAADYASGGDGGSASGAGILATGASRISGCTFSGNFVTARDGAGIGSFGKHGGNAGNANGAAVQVASGSSIVSCTIVGNAAIGGRGGDAGVFGQYHGGNGGNAGGAAIEIATGGSIISCTISTNTVVAGTGGLSLNGSPGVDGQALGGGIHITSGTITIRNTIVAGNTGSSPDVSGTFSSTGFNFIGITNNTSGWITSDIQGSSISPRDPLLGPLQDNGGPTPTMALLDGSGAIDHGNSGGLTTDQRGLTRPVNLPDAIYPNAAGGDGADIGAYERPPLSRVPVTLPATQVSTSTATLNGAVNPIGLATTAWFEWGTATDYGQATKTINAGSGYSALPITTALTGLTPGQTYHFRAAARSLAGTVYGDDLTFTTVPLALVVTHSGNSVIVSWPSPSTGFVLMENANPGNANWVSTPQTPSDNGTTKTVTVTPSGKRFYQLRHP